MNPQIVGTLQVLGILFGPSVLVLALIWLAEYTPAMKKGKKPLTGSTVISVVFVLYGLACAFIGMVLGILFVTYFGG